jgi:hypothetical protein
MMNDGVSLAKFYSSRVPGFVGCTFDKLYGYENTLKDLRYSGHPCKTHGFWDGKTAMDPQGLGFRVNPKP